MFFLTLPPSPSYECMQPVVSYHSALLTHVPELFLCEKLSSLNCVFESFYKFFPLLRKKETIITTQRTNFCSPFPLHFPTVFILQFT